MEYQASLRMYSYSFVVSSDEGGGGGGGAADGGIKRDIAVDRLFRTDADAVPVTDDTTLADDPRKFSPANEEETDSFTDPTSVGLLSDSGSGVSLFITFKPSTCTVGRESESDFEAA
jgi:hypothetical protein